MGSNARYDVDQWTCIMAIRYGMGRLTGANEDAADLARRIWPDLDEYTRDNLRRDTARLPVGSLEREAWQWMYP